MRGHCSVLSPAPCSPLPCSIQAARCSWQTVAALMWPCPAGVSVPPSWSPPARVRPRHWQCQCQWRVRMRDFPAPRRAAAVVDLAADSDADADSDSDIRVGATTGFANIGNTCYLSALLQVSCPIHPTQRNASENCSSEFLNTVSLLDAANFCFVLLFGELRTVRSASSTPQSFCSGWTGAGGTGWALVGSSIKYMLAGV